MTSAANVAGDLAVGLRLLRAKRRFLLEPWEMELYGLKGKATEHPSYLSKNAWHHVVVPQLNDRRFFMLLDNKWVFASYCGQQGVSVPTTYGLFEPSYGSTSSGSPLRTIGDLDALAREVGGSFVIKPVEGNAGRGIVIVDETDWGRATATFRTSNGSDLTLSSLEQSLRKEYNRSRGFLVEELLRPSPWVESVTAGAPHSVRVITLFQAGGVPKVYLAFLRMGREGQMADNWETGGIAAGVDLDSGRLGHGITRFSHGSDRLTHHPDSGVVFKGSMLPGWADVRTLCQQAAETVPWLRCVGWDVVLTHDGPRIVEGNPGFRIQFLQRYYGGLLESPIATSWQNMNIDLPDGTRRWAYRHRKSRLSLSSQLRRVRAGRGSFAEWQRTRRRGYRTTTKDSPDHLNEHREV